MRVVGAVDVDSIRHDRHRLTRLAEVAQGEKGDEGDYNEHDGSNDAVGAQLLGTHSALDVGAGLSLALHTRLTLGRFLGGKRLHFGGGQFRFSYLLLFRDLLLFGSLLTLGLLRALLLLFVWLGLRA
jgi:hypothetical protein